MLCQIPFSLNDWLCYLHKPDTQPNKNIDMPLFSTYLAAADGDQAWKESI